MITLHEPIKKKMIIKGMDIKVSLGHPNRTIGTGVHKDKRQRRQGNRSAQLRRALAD